MFQNSILHMATHCATLEPFNYAVFLCLWFSSQKKINCCLCSVPIFVLCLMLHIKIAFPKITFKIIHRKLSGKNENFTLKILNYMLEYLICVKCCSPFIF